MSKRGRVDKRTRQRGAVLVEAAIIAPIAIALVFGAMELGYAYYGKLTVEHMSIAGARAASGSANDYLSDYNTLQAVKDGTMRATLWLDLRSAGTVLVDAVPEILKAGASWQPKSVVPDHFVVTKENLDEFMKQHPN